MAEAPTEVTISDDAYAATQRMIAFVAGLLLDPSLLALDRFIERAERSLAVGPILDPSEFRDGAQSLTLVLAHAHALRDARDAVAKAVTP